jgi:hypothetical protein
MDEGTTLRAEWQGHGTSHQVMKRGLLGNLQLEVSKVN